VFIALETLGLIREVGSAPVHSNTWTEDVNARARLLQAETSEGAPIVIVQAASRHFFIDLFSVWSSGRTAICLDPSLTKPEIENIVRFSRAEIVLGKPGSDFSYTDMLAQKTAPQPGRGAAGHSMLDEPALVLFTSGTTGDPKGVVHTFRSLFSRISINILAAGLKRTDVALLTLPVHFGHGLIGNALSPLFAGAELIVGASGAQLAARLGTVIDDEKVSFLSSVPALWRMAMKMSPRPRHGTLRRVHVGSAPVSVELMRQIEAWAGCEVHNCYGITETANWIGSASSRDPLLCDGFVGRPWAGSAAVLQDRTTISSPGEGEILIQTPSLMSSYLGRPDLTAASFIDGWYKTGDWGTVDHLGNIRLSGRIKDEINRAGFKVQPAEIDMLLEQHENVEEACAFGIPDEIGTEIVGIALKLKHRTASDERSLREWCLKRIRREAVPERWFFVDDIPKTPRGKLKRDQVRAILMGTTG
jgi:acyl-CoA synthetase (AMP-forming)/AMP-acid ligase II